MEERSTYLKYVFNLDCILGISVYTFGNVNVTAEQRLYNYVWTVFFLVTSQLHAVQQVYSHLGQLSALTVHRMLCDLFLVYALGIGLYMPKRRITAAL